MSRRFYLDPRDRELFRSSVGTVKPLRHDRAEPRREPPRPLPRSTARDEDQVLVDMMSEHFEPADWETGEELSYCRAGVQQAVLRKLRRGRFRVSAELDLHGMTVPRAREALVAFLRDARREGLSCVRVIHGKGNGSRHKGPVIKLKVNQWLRQREEIVAFCSALPVDGGTGAVYVLLRRS